MTSHSFIRAFETRFIKFGACALGLLLLLSSESALAITIQFDYRFDSNQFFNRPERRNALEAAADIFEVRLLDDLERIEASNGQSWTANFFDPSKDPSDFPIIEPSRGSIIDDGLIRLPNLLVPEDTLIVFVGGAALSGNTLAFGGPGGSSVRFFGGDPSGSQAFRDNVEARGEVGGESTELVSFPDGGFGQIFREFESFTDFGRWGGSITFGNDINWNFDVENGPAPEQSDFLSTAIHELGHVLGFGTASSWRNQVVTNSFSGNSTFNGEASIRENFGVAPSANSFRSGHLDPGITSFLLNPFTGEVSDQEVLMNPFLTQGTRRLFTELDFAGLDDLGWDVGPPTVFPPDPVDVPTPSLLLGLLGLGAKLTGISKNSQ